MPPQPPVPGFEPKTYTAPPNPFRDYAAKMRAQAAQFGELARSRNDPTFLDQQQKALEAAQAAELEAAKVDAAHAGQRQTVDQAEAARRQDYAFKEFQAKLKLQDEARAQQNQALPPAAREKIRAVRQDAMALNSAIDRFAAVFKEQGGGGINTWLNNPRDPKAQTLITAYNNMITSLRSEAFVNTGVLQPAEMAMLKEQFLSPESFRGAIASPEAMQAKLDELKRYISMKIDAAERSPTSAPAAAPPPPAAAPAPSGGGPSGPWDRYRK